jgi:hypothetical protein
MSFRRYLVWMLTSVALGWLVLYLYCGFLTREHN